MSKFEFGKQIGRTLQGLLTRFVLQRGRKPNNLEMILLKREAAETGVQERKIISMVDRQPVNPNEPIVGGQNLKKEFISETDDEIIARLKKGNEDSINRLKNKKEPEDMADGGRTGYSNGLSVDPERDSFKKISNVLGAYRRYRRGEKNPALNFNQFFELFSKENFAIGGRAGYYGGGITNMIEPDLSDIGHGGEAMNSRTRVMSPGSQATTSTGLNYLLGEDNDTTRVPYNEGNMVLPKAKPAQSPLVELSRIYKTYEDAMPGVSKDTQQYLQNDFKEKLNNAKISVEEFMTYRMQNNLADGGRAGYDQGGSSQPMGPEFSTNDPKEALKEIINRFIPIKDYGIPLLGNSQLMFNGLDNVQAGGQSDLFGGELNYGLKKSLKDDKFGLGFEFKKSFADGGRIGYVGGGGVNLARRGFLKLAGATVASVAALKTGLVKILGKTAATAVPKMVTIPAGSGAPAWFEGMVNKVLADGIDITKKASTLDGQVVKSLDTPTGKVDVTFDTRTGSIDAFYKGENTALGESVDMRYTVGQADEGTKIKPADEFEAVEAVPEMQGFNVDDTELAFGENVVSDVKGLYSDTSELAELGGQKVLIKDIAESIQKKRVLKKMNENPDEFASDNLPDYDY